MESFIESFEKEPGLNWELIERLVKSSLGLRHAPSVEILRKEAEQGFQGDALAINNISGLVDLDKISVDTNIKKFMDRFKITRLDPELFNEFIALIPQQEQKTVLTGLEGAIKNHIRASITSQNVFEKKLPNNAALEEKRGFVEKYINYLASISGFSLVQWNKEGSYDTQQYGGLGKFGSTAISPDAIKAEITLTTEDIVQKIKMVDLLKETPSEIDKIITNTYVDMVFTRIISELKSVLA